MMVIANGNDHCVETLRALNMFKEVKLCGSHLPARATHVRALLDLVHRCIALDLEVTLAQSRPLQLKSSGSQRRWRLVGKARHSKAKGDQ